jgi:hypothetical protein
MQNNMYMGCSPTRWNNQAKLIESSIYKVLLFFGWVRVPYYVNWSGRRETPAGVRGWGDPAGAEGDEEAPRHARGKRSAWSGN